MKPAHQTGARQDDGVTLISVATIAPIFVVVVGLLIIYVHGMGEAAAAARKSARQSARSASLEFTASQAQAAAKKSVNKNTSEATCQMINIETGDMSPGSTVTVTVSCQTQATGFIDKIVGAETFTVTATEAVDSYRRTNQ